MKNVIKIFIILIILGMNLTAKCMPIDFDSIPIPEYFRQINSVNNLIDSTKSPDSSARFYSLLRMIEIGNSKSIPAIIDLYNNIHSGNGDMDQMAGIEYYSIYGIGKIGGPEAKEYLWKLAGSLITNRIINRPLMGDTLYRFKGLFDALSLVETSDKANFFYNIFNEDSINVSIRRMAYETYQRLNLKTEQFHTIDDSLVFLMNELNESGKGKRYIAPGKPSKDFIVRQALESIIVDISMVYPGLIQNYKTNFKLNDPFIDEINRLIKITDDRVKNMNSYKK